MDFGFVFLDLVYCFVATYFVYIFGDYRVFEFKGDGIVGNGSFGEFADFSSYFSLLESVGWDLEIFFGDYFFDFSEFDFGSN